MAEVGLANLLRSFASRLAAPLSYLRRSNVENVCNLYGIVITIGIGQVRHLLRLFVQRAANTEDIFRSHMDLDSSYGTQILMPKKFLDRHDVITIFQ